VQLVADNERICRDFNLLPFPLFSGRTRWLRTESPAVWLSDCGILLLFSGLYADYLLLHSRSGLAHAPLELTPGLRRARHHVLPVVVDGRV